MNSRESPVKTVVLVVPEFPQLVESLNCVYVDKLTSSVKFILEDDTKVNAYLPSVWTRSYYTSSDADWFVKCHGEISKLAVKFVNSFFKLYRKPRKKVLYSGICQKVLSRMSRGLSCEDCCSLQGALIDALALKIWKDKLRYWANECACCQNWLLKGCVFCERNPKRVQKLYKIRKKVW